MRNQQYNILNLHACYTLELLLRINLDNEKNSGEEFPLTKITFIQIEEQYSYNTYFSLNVAI